jgi:diguanylate cyclase (GGDEF)-like protein
MRLPWSSVPRPAAPLDLADEQRLLAEVVLRAAAGLVGRDDDPQSTIARTCQQLTSGAPHLVLAWTWFGPADTAQIRPQTMAGRAAGYAQALTIDRTPLTACGPAFRTLAGQRLAPYAVSGLSPYGPWRHAARAHGMKTTLALPLTSCDPALRGLLVLYADVDGYFDQVGVGLFEALAQLFSAVLSRTARNAELARAAHRDPLTGLGNRQAVAELAPTLWRSAATDRPASVVMVDIDHFKRINDAHGHATGDAVLRAVAHRLQAAVRVTDTVARWGGEEFLVCLPGAALLIAARVAEALRLTLASTEVDAGDGRRLPLTASLGVAELALGEPLDSAIARADQALYQAKHGGRNRVALADVAAAAPAATSAVTPAEAPAASPAAASA